METKGGCCIARFEAGAYSNMSKVDMIMLKFRPIAPKPLPAGGAVSDASSSDSGSAGAKRKSRKSCGRGIRRKRTAVTLPLLPETPDPRDPAEERRKTEPVWLSFENPPPPAADRRWFPAAVGLGGSVVTVECMTETRREEEEGETLGRRRRRGGEEEWKVKLAEDTCPGFISDGYGRVTWTNGAYKEAVGGGGVWLAMKVPVAYPYGGFTCRVRVQHACGKERTFPCDVWRTESGGFVWRLDVKAALCLSLAL